MTKEQLKALKKKYNNGEVWHEANQVSSVDKKKGIINLISCEPVYTISEETMLIWKLLNYIEELQNKLK